MGDSPPLDEESWHAYDCDDTFRYALVYHLMSLIGSQKKRFLVQGPAYLCALAATALAHAGAKVSALIDAEDIPHAEFYQESLESHISTGQMEVLVGTLQEGLRSQAYDGVMILRPIQAAEVTEVSHLLKDGSTLFYWGVMDPLGEEFGLPPKRLLSDRAFWLTHPPLTSALLSVVMLKHVPRAPLRKNRLLYEVERLLFSGDGSYFYPSCRIRKKGFSSLGKYQATGAEIEILDSTGMRGDVPILGSMLPP